MTGEHCLYALIHAPREVHDALLAELVLPVVREVRGSPALDSLFFARYDQPDWQLRFRVLGQASWVEEVVRPRVAERLPALRDAGLLSTWEFASYQREYERYGGECGMRLAEQLFLHDTLACLELLDLRTRGLLAGSVREYSLVFTERFLDLLAFDRAQRIAFYRQGYAWALSGGDWSAEDLDVLEARYRKLKPGLLDLFWPPPGDEAAFGGMEAAGIAEACLAASRPVAAALVDGLATGSVRQDPVQLAWSICHMHCNRLGIDVSAEAILRRFMHRLHEDQAIVAG